MPWKKTIAVTAILLAVLLLAVYWWISRFDFNRLKPIITQQVRSAIAREITIEGDIRLKIGLAPTLMPALSNCAIPTGDPVRIC